MVHLPLIFLSEWREFPSAPCLTGEKKKKNFMTARVSMLLKSPGRLTCFLSASVTCKDLQIGNEQTPLSNDTIDSVLRHWQVGRAKDLTAPPRIRILSL